MEMQDFTEVTCLSESRIEFMRDTPGDRKNKAMAKLYTFFDKLKLENPEVRMVHWERQNGG